MNKKEFIQKYLLTRVSVIIGVYPDVQGIVTTGEKAYNLIEKICPEEKDDRDVFCSGCGMNERICECGGRGGIPASVNGRTLCDTHTHCCEDCCNQSTRPSAQCACGNG